MKRRYLWLLLAAALLGAAALLMPSADPASAPAGAAAPQVHFPDQPRPGEAQAMRQRLTLPPQALPPTAAGDKPKPDDLVVLQKRDPLLTALPAVSELVVFDAKTFFQRPVGQMFAGCVRIHDLAQNATGNGLDWKRIDRIGVSNPWGGDRLIAISSQPGAVQPTKMFKLGEPTSYGSAAKIFAPPGVPADTPAAHGPPVFAGVWSDQLVLFSATRAGIEQAIDRLDGRVPSQPAFPQEDAYSEIYGRISARSAAEVLLSGAIAAQVANTDLAAQFHIDASDDVAVVLDASGSSTESRDIAKALAAGLAARRLEAAAIRDKRLSQLLDLYSVTQRDRGFQLKVAFPVDYLHDLLGGCAHAKASTGAAGSAP